ncbi:uncharacterized protein PHALS_06313 [Plasmopara halstedii]|uniref:Uncharacterized protein n=1 Tax=Plasmopara halstedii TaxID=4781 RepID=A0A0P1B2K2_PLAHL|nr:uncharacterized protein PHALS_06313 [Plasmopara halstedii]CEG48494.1 hypothetical protein PHALS_06313 [Plasmopara halstedii]|eukprot:XP_024584863.1 hypothetical protein PHALS_06313 [Plasmopara halstedii]
MEEKSRANQHHNGVCRITVAKPVGRLNKPYFQNRDERIGDKIELESISPAQLSLWNGISLIQSAEQLAEWIYNVANQRSINLTLNCCERNEIVRDALLRRFNCWPETKNIQAAKRYQKLIQKAHDQCHEQVQLYLHDLRGKLLAGAETLFWLSELQPLVHPAIMTRLEAKDTLEAFVDEIKSIDGFYQQLNNGRLWPTLTLPFKLEFLFQGVFNLVLQGFTPAAYDAMQIFKLFAENYTTFDQRAPRGHPIGISIIASIGALFPFDTADLKQLDEEICVTLSSLLTRMARDWIRVVGQVLELLEKILITKWELCEQIQIEEELIMSVQKEIQNTFEQLKCLLLADKLNSERPSGDRKALNVKISNEGGQLFKVDLS